MHAHNTLDRRFYPWRWIMLSQASSDVWKRRDFLNISTTEHIWVNLPELRHHFVFESTSDGLIVMCDKRTYAVRLLNPLTRQLTVFPDGTTMLYPLKSRITMYRNRLQEIQVTGAGPAYDSSTMALHFGVRRIAIAQPAAEEWRKLGYFKSWIRASLSLAGCFYCVTEEGIMVLDVTGKWLRLVMAAEEEQGLEKWPYQDTVNLVDNDGELILVKSKGASTTDLPTKYEVHQVDLHARKTVPTHGIRGRAVFVSGQGQSILTKLT
ncbi:hypothetical protein ACQ4PT_021835 [Festuca glaucescens]